MSLYALRNDPLISSAELLQPGGEFYPKPSGQGLRLVALDQGTDIAVGRMPVIVGRHYCCDVRLESVRVSRRHCCLVEDCGEVLVRDLGSTNGVWINGVRILVGRLRPGDELWVAHLRFSLQCVETPPKEPKPDSNQLGPSSDGTV